MKKVFFLANYYHLNLPIYEKIVDEMNGRIDPYLLELQGNTVNDPEGRYPDDYFKQRGFTKLSVKLRTFQHNGVKNKVLAVKPSLSNYLSLSSILKKENPDVIVMGSDLGDLNARFLAEHCMLQGIRIIILYLCDIPHAEKKQIMYFFSKVMFGTRISFIRYLRALFYAGDIVGTYALNSKLFVISKEIREKLIENGICSKRIQLYNYTINSVINREQLLSELQIPNDQRIVTFYTECLQEIYGVDYITKLYSDLANIFRKVSNQKLLFVIKPHPLEPEYIIDLLKKVFSGEEFKFVKDIKADNLICLSNINIAHYSRVLIESCVLGKPILSINFNKDPNRTFLTENEADILEVNSVRDIEHKILRLLDDNEFRVQAEKAVKMIAIRFSSTTSNSDFNFALLGLNKSESLSESKYYSLI